MLLFVMVAGKPPFQGKNMKETFECILRDSLNFKPYPWISEQAKTLISKVPVCCISLCVCVCGVCVCVT